MYHIILFHKFSMHKGNIIRIQRESEMQKDLTVFAEKTKTSFENLKFQLYYNNKINIR